MTLQDLRDLLGTIGLPVAHYEMLNQPDRYIVWAEYMCSPLCADNNQAEILWKVQIDLFTKTEYDPAAESVVEELLKNEVAIIDRSTTYETDTGYIHHIYDVEVT